MNFLVSGTIIGFLLFLFIIISVIISLYVRKQPTQKEIEQNKIISRMGLVILPVSFGIVLIIITINLLTGASIKQDDDIANWITLTVEIGVGISIGITILIYSQFQSKRSLGALSKEVKKEVKKEVARLSQLIINTISSAPIYKVEIPTGTDTSQQEFFEGEEKEPEFFHEEGGESEDSNPHH